MIIETILFIIISSVKCMYFSRLFFIVDFLYYYYMIEWIFVLLLYD